MTRTGSLEETYVAAIQHGLVEVPDSATLVGVVRRPTSWFHAAVDENRPSIAPPAALLDEFRRRVEDLKMRGLCDEGAHNSAWEELDVEDRYRAHLDGDPDAAKELDALVDRLRGGEDLVVVCFENTDKKRCHRTVLVEALRDRL